MKPKRIQLRRTKGWRLPANTVVVARPSKWGNPFTLETARGLHPAESEAESRARVVRAFRAFVDAEESRREIRGKLRGKNLACWCKPGAPCHANVLLEIANA